MPLYTRGFPVRIMFQHFGDNASYEDVPAVEKRIAPKEGTNQEWRWQMATYGRYFCGPGPEEEEHGQQKRKREDQVQQGAASTAAGAVPTQSKSQRPAGVGKLKLAQRRKAATPSRTNRLAPDPPDNISQPPASLACPHCAKIFKSKVSLVCHMGKLPCVKRQTRKGPAGAEAASRSEGKEAAGGSSYPAGVDGRPLWACEPCGKQFKGYSGLYYHNKKFHDGKKIVGTDRKARGVAQPPAAAPSPAAAQSSQPRRNATSDNVQRLSRGERGY